MIKLLTTIISLVLASATFADEYRIITEQKFYNLDGTQQLNKGTVVWNFTIKSYEDSSYKLFSNVEFLNPYGNLKSEASEGVDFSADSVKQIGNFYNSCDEVNGIVEDLKVKAGTFQTCKFTYFGPSYILWYIKDFPFPIKRVLQSDEGFTIWEATEVKIIK